MCDIGPWLASTKRAPVSVGTEAGVKFSGDRHVLAKADAGQFAAAAGGRKLGGQVCRHGGEGRGRRPCLRAQPRQTQVRKCGDHCARAPQVLDRGPQRAIGPALACRDDRDDLLGLACGHPTG